MDTTNTTIRFDFFFRTERTDFVAYWADENNAAFCASMMLPADTTLAQALQAATDARLLSKGSSRGGCFEVQSDLGIFALPNNARRNIRFCLDQVVFKTWEQLEAEEKNNVA